MTVRWRAPVRKPLLAFQTPKPVPPDPRAYETFRVVSPFGNRVDPLDPKGERTVFHGGLDIGNFRQGDDIVAAADGIVEAVGFLKEPYSLSTSRWPSGNYGGWMVVVRHADGYKSIYAHMQPDSSPLKPGQRVEAGALLGKVGASGSAAGAPHLHFGIQRNGTDVDPWPLVTASEDDVPTFGAGELKYAAGSPTFVIVEDANFRADPTTALPPLGLLAKGTTFRAAFAVTGQSVGGNDQWYETRKWASGRFRLGYIHSSAAARVAQPEPPAPADCSAQDAKLQEAGQRFAAIEAAASAGRTGVQS